MLEKPQIIVIKLLILQLIMLNIVLFYVCELFVSIACYFLSIFN